jgi:hypothetical protein
MLNYPSVTGASISSTKTPLQSPLALFADRRGHLDWLRARMHGALLLEQAVNVAAAKMSGASLLLDESNDPTRWSSLPRWGAAMRTKQHHINLRFFLAPSDQQRGASSIGVCTKVTVTRLTLICSSVLLLRHSAIQVIRLMLSVLSRKAFCGAPIEGSS